jgi:predicted phosphodiesterase
MVTRLPTAPVARPIGFLSDVHGNLPALDAALAALEERDVADVYVAGDLLLGGEDPLGVWRRLQQVDAKCVRGTSDTALIEVDPEVLKPSDDRERARAELFARTRAEIGDLVVEQLRRLPETLRIPLIDGSEIVVVHGSPADPTIEITHDMSDDEVLALLADDPADIVVCGGSHVPFERRAGDVYVVNTGTVGDNPSGERVADFVVMTPAMDGVRVERAHVPY